MTLDPLGFGQQDINDIGPLAGLQDAVAAQVNQALPDQPIIPGPDGTFLPWPGRPAQYQAPPAYQTPHQAPVFTGQPGQPREPLTAGEIGMLLLVLAVVVILAGAVAVGAMWVLH